MTITNDTSRWLLRGALLCAGVAFSAFGAGCGADAVSGTGGSGGGSGGTGTATGGRSTVPDCDAAFGPTDPTALIDDMEDADSLIAMVSGRNGSWWVTGDDTPGGTVAPPSGGPPPPERILGGRCDSQRAIRVTGQGFAQWGAVVAAGMGYDSKAVPTDASAFKGIMFWARVGESNNSHVRVQLQDSHTYPEGGVCDPTPGSAEECYNGFGTELVPIDTTWRLYKIPFARITQRDFGYRSDTFDTTQIYSVEWNLDASSVFDLWIDDVWFYE